MSIVDDVRAQADALLGVRDSLGAVKSKVYLLTRTWQTEKGIGSPVDVIEQVLPSPNIVTFQHSFRVREGGNIQQGDIMLKGISQGSYPLKSDVDCTVEGNLTDKYYFFDGYLYEVKSVEKKYVTWNVLVVKTSKNRLEIPE